MTDVSDHDETTDAQSIDAAALPTALPERYKILKILGQGGAGVVYKARDTTLDKLVAIKMLRRAASQNEALRFHREAQLAGALNHPNVMSVLDFGLTKANDPYLVMSFVNGESLAERLERKGLLPLGEALNLFLQIAQGLSHAHNRSIIHRDIKPSNVMLVKTSDAIVAQIVDFGLAKATREEQRLTAPGASVGTPTYMSPEQIRGEAEIDQRSDIYSFGCLMYRVLTGRPPFLGRTAVDTISMHLNEEPPALENPNEEPLSDVLQDMVFTALSKDAGKRQQKVEVIIEVLKREISSIGAEDVSLTLSEAKSGLRPLSRRELGFASLILGLTLIVGIGWMSLVKRADSDKPKMEAGDLSSSSLTGAPHGDEVKVSGARVDPLDKIKIEKLFYLRNKTWEPDTSVNDKQLARFVKELAPKAPFNIDLSSCDVSPAGLVALKNCRIIELYFHDRPINHAMTRQLAQISNVRIIELGETDEVDPDAIRDLEKLPKLSGFGLHEVTLTQEILNSICSLPHIERLDLNRCVGGENVDWSACKSLTKLREFKLDGTKLGPDAVKQISELNGLHRLDLKFIKLSDADIKALGTMPSRAPLRVILNLYSEFPYDFVTREQVAYLKNKGFSLLIEESKSGFHEFTKEKDRR